MKKKIKLIFIMIIVTAPLLSFAQQRISKIEILGNKVVSTANILSKIKTQVGNIYNEALVNEDIKNLYSTGYFENIEIEKKIVDGELVLFYKVEEKPIVKEVVVEGLAYPRKKRIEKMIDIKKESFLDEMKLKEIKDKILDFYNKRGFSETEVNYKIGVNNDKEAKIVFNIEEKDLIRVKKILIKGNTVFREKQIKKLMKTKEKGFLSKGIFKDETLEDDVKRIEDFYKERGYSEVNISSQVDYLKGYAYITINIIEGERYYIGRINIEGNEEITLEILEKGRELKSGDIFVERKVNDEVNRLRGLYIDRGYIYSQVIPSTFLNPDTQKIDINFRIVESELSYVERIDIVGNLKTKDKVIRRELRIYPGDKFEGEKIRKSRRRLENLGFFEEIRFDTQPGSQPNYENLIVEVKEAKTGYLSFGGGYSSIDEFTGFVELRQRNFDYKNWSTFTGGGQDLSLMASFGTITENYELNFLNPWIFDIPVSFGFEGYKRSHQREEDVGYGYEQVVKGGAIKFGREFSDNFKGDLGYRIESVEICDVVETATQELKDETGRSDLSSLEFSLAFDTRDNVFTPSKGLYLANVFQVTGGFLGGDKDFLSYFSRLSLYYSLLKKSVIELRLRLGLADPFSNTDKVPIYRRFFAGGSSTIRGYNERKVGPIDPITEDPIGGEAMFVGNIEYTYPLIDILKVATFFDTGNVWSKRSDIFSGGFKSSVGAGIRVKTPLGPINLDYGWPLNLEPGEEGKEGKFHFSISRGF
ncbi:MAG: outer membrane protein assembly factor BamA [Candidatus Omnitrophica bacterium]|nr:outer membrane protein assembly factor BamA [Candidatus Omnitrophota bacterium]